MAREQHPACAHADAKPVRSGVIRDGESAAAPFDAAYCRACGAFREASATSDPQPWLLPPREHR